MNRQTMQGNWKEIKGKLQSKWGKLTNDDLEQAAGKFESLVGSIEKRYGLAKQVAEKQLDDFIVTLADPKATTSVQGKAVTSKDQHAHS